MSNVDTAPADQEVNEIQDPLTVDLPDFDFSTRLEPHMDPGLYREIVTELFEASSDLASNGEKCALCILDLRRIGDPENKLGDKLTNKRWYKDAVGAARKRMKVKQPTTSGWLRTIQEALPEDDPYHIEPKVEERKTKVARVRDSGTKNTLLDVLATLRERLQDEAQVIAARDTLGKKAFQDELNALVKECVQASTWAKGTLKKRGA